VSPAQFRGPRIHNQFDDSPDEFDPALDVQPPRPTRAGRIILLGDGTEVLTDIKDDDMFEDVDEDRDLENQVQKASSAGLNEAARSEREGTPGPQVNHQSGPKGANDPSSTQGLTASPGLISGSPPPTATETSQRLTNDKPSKS
jgi:protein phosphatase 2C family protein 2/3